LEFAQTGAQHFLIIQQQKRMFGNFLPFHPVYSGERGNHCWLISTELLFLSVILKTYSPWANPRKCNSTNMHFIPTRSTAKDRRCGGEHMRSLKSLFKSLV
jgi:hypothetical protein